MSNARTTIYTPGDPMTAIEDHADTAPLPELLESTIASIEGYARDKPWHFGLWAMGIGFVLGWKMKFF